MATRASWWRALAMDSLNSFAASDTGSLSSFAYGTAAGAAGYLNGWTHSYTESMLVKLLATRNPDGGYGLGRPYDAFNDGSVNPATTTYTVTLAGQVGPTLLAAESGGSVTVSRSHVQDVIDLLMATPRVPYARGEVVAYSGVADDAVIPVWNVSAGVGWFLSDANAAGYGAPGMQKLITNITISTQIAYREIDFWWPYMGDGALQDADHNSYTAEAAYRLFYWPGREVAYRMMAGTFPPGTSSELDPIVYARLAGLPGGTGSWDKATSATATLWGKLAVPHYQDLLNYQASMAGDALRSAQLAYYAARASRMVGA